MKAPARFAAIFARSGSSLSQGCPSVRRDASSGAKGSSAPSSRRAPLALVAGLALIASLAFAAPALAAPPAATLDPITGPHYTSVHASGTFDLGDAKPTPFSVCYFSFQYSTDGVNWSINGAEEAGCPQGPVSQNLSADITGLAYDTEYHIRLTVHNTDGAFAVLSPEQTITTEPEPTNPPLVATNPATPVAYTTAHLSGTIDPQGGNVNPGGDAVGIAWHFQYSTDPVNNGWTDGTGGEISGAEAEGNSPIPVAADPPSLTQHTSYFFRLVTSYGDIQVLSPEPDRSFETLEVTPPAVEINSASAITTTSAHLSGQLNPEAPGTAPQDPGFDTEWRFVCSPECPGLTAATIGGDNADHEVTAEATGLEPAKTYEVTLEATNAGGTSIATKSFTTGAILPPVKSAPGASDGKGGYNLQGVVNAHNSAVSCVFEYGPNVPYAYSATCSPNPGGVNKPVTVEAHVTGLTPGATYHTKLIVTNSVGTVESEDLIFIPTLDPSEPPCPNEVLREENNSLALPECRAFEQVTPSNKDGFSATRFALSEDGPAVGYASSAGNIANSGAGIYGCRSKSLRRGPLQFRLGNDSQPGWAGGSPYSPPYSLNASLVPFGSSTDLRTSFWWIEPNGEKNSEKNRAYLREPDGSFALLGGAFTKRLAIQLFQFGSKIRSLACGDRHRHFW